MQNIDGRTRLIGLVGNPVEHSLSPLIHNFLADKMNINEVYTTFKVKSDKIDEAVKGALALNILGFNITVPHKSAVISQLNETDELARAIGAVNTAVRTDNGYKGYNTDISGLKRELSDYGISLKDKKVVILGAGGASRAITFLCAAEGAEEILLLNRTVEKAVDIAENVNSYFKKDIVKCGKPDEYMQHMTNSGYIAIQTSSVGLFPDVDKAVIEEDEFYKKLDAAVDIIYNPAVTKFMKIAEKNGVAAYNGLKMLLYQGVKAFELWNNIKVPQEYIDELYSMLKEKFNG